jgi:DNA-directed RNA polymerase subunit RPC12/RpoP
MACIETGATLVIQENEIIDADKYRCLDCGAEIFNTARHHHPMKNAIKRLEKNGIKAYDFINRI